MQDFTFKHSEQVDAIYTQYTAQQIKALFDSRGEELRIALNLLITALNSTEGASNIGTNTIQDIDGTTIQEMLKSIRDKLKSKTDSGSGADFVHATAIEGLAGESVQAILESLKGLVDGNKSALETSIDSVQTNLDSKINTSIAGVKASNISADPIAVGSGNTVQAQLIWLLSQIAVAATGSIPDGTLTEAKLAQALVDKINKSLSNIGVLTTLSTEDKSSLVNALNEHSADGTAHGIGNKATLLTTNKTSIVAALNELFTNANNLKADWASVVGSPLVSGDTSAQLKSKTQTIKNALATNLTAKGQSSVGTETLTALVNKVLNVNTGKKWAMGTTKAFDNGNYTGLLYVTGLGFRPRNIIAQRARFSTNTAIYSADAPYTSVLNKFAQNGSADVNSVFSVGDGWFQATPLTGMQNEDINWFATE